MTSSPKLLLVDDEPLILAAVGRALRRSGYEVATAENVHVALAQLSESPFDLVLTDLRMPVLDGTALLRTIRARHPGLPVVVMTGYGDVSDSELRRLGACAVLGKPAEIAVIRAALASCLEGRRSA
jgi:DNA-binding NtrC family response regulator